MTSQAIALPSNLSTPVAKIRSSKPRKNKTQNGPESIPMLRMRAEDGVIYHPSARTPSASSGNSVSSGQKSRVKCPSMDSGVSNRYRSTESEGSSPAEYQNLENRSKAGSRVDDVIAYNGAGNTKERYKTTASDRDADMEVSEILSSESQRESSIWQSHSEEDLGEPEYDVTPFRGIRSSASVTSPKSIVSRHRREIGDVVRHKGRNSNSSRRYQTNPRTLYPIDDVQHLHSGGLGNHSYALPIGKSPAGISSGPESSRANSALTLTDTEPERCDVINNCDDIIIHDNGKRHHTLASDKLTKSASSTEANAGVSSNDTHRSSVRYEPVVTDHSCTPPSPGRHGSRHKLLGNGKSNKHRSSRLTDDDITDEERHDSRDDDVGDDDDIGSMDDVIRSEELRPLNARRRMSSPVIEQHGRDQYSAHRESNSFLARTNSGTVYVTKGVPSTLPIEPRHQTGLPRMGTGLPPPGTSVSSQNTAPIGTPQLYKPQVPTSLVSSRLPSSQTDQFDSVVLTTLKPTHEADQSGWNYVGASEVRTQYPFSGGVSSSLPPHIHSSTTPSGEDTAARFMSKRPSLANAYNASRHISNTQFEASTFKCFKNKMSSGCSWKCSALVFIVISVVLLALVAFFLVQSLSTSSPIESHDSKCVASSQTDENGAAGGDAAASEMPLELQIGRNKLFTVPVGMFWRSLVHMGDDGHLKFNFTVNRRAVLGIYGRKGIKPSHTKYDFFEKIDGSSVPVAAADMAGRRKRDTSSREKVTLSFVQFMKSGNWHIGVYNDGDEEEQAEIKTKLAEGISSCPNNCNGNGDCIDGICKCFPRFQGRDCSEATCPIVCSGRGLVAHGACVCFSGWKGRDCSVPTDQCEVKDCSGHGTCGSDGECECEAGWTGRGCDIVTCLSATCSDHGVCVDGECHCDRGFKGQICEEEDTGCFDKCNGHGNFNDVTGSCVCDPGWSGRGCAKASAISPLAPCQPACHTDHGTCISGSCHCNEGWTGAACDQRMCHPSCYEHGTCSNGRCICGIGWNGDLCTFDGCPSKCGGHGRCTKDTSGEWSCSCQPGWKGERCNIAVETQCGDGRDNDRDTLIDCHDPDCCSQAACTASKECRGSSDPARVLARKPSRTRRLPKSTFYERVQFLVNPSSSIQTTSHPATFNPKETSVLRGKVVTLDGSPLVGVRVRIDGMTAYGFTKTRKDGWYDIMVNGGGSVTLHFDRTLLLSQTTTIFVPLNDFVLVPMVTMRTSSQPEQLVADTTVGEPGHCDVSVFSRPRAIVLPINVQAFTADNCPDRGSVIPETQAVRESIGLPFSGVDLIYLSSRTSGYKSKIEIQLTPQDVASNLNTIHLRISVQGLLFEKMFEPIPELRYTFVWSRRDAYDQPVYGTVIAKVEVGYEYELCPSIVWDMHLTTLEGQDPIMTQTISGWSMSIHHTYHGGVVHLGNGGTMKLNRQPPMMSTVMGTGAQRHPSCDRCTGPARTSKLLAPVSLACDAHGNVYVGDYNYIRKIGINGQVNSLLFMRNPPHKYYIATSPTLDGTLYYSDPNGKRIYQIRNMNPTNGRRILSSADLSTNMEVMAGTGAACLPLAQGNCGDGRPAHSAKLSGPRGLAVDKTGRVYFVDGTTVRTIETNGIIKTFAGSNNMAATRPLPCDGTISLDQLQLDFPTDLSINLFDGSLYVLDTNVVVKIDVLNKQASLAAGVPMHCMRKAVKNLNERDSRRVPLVSPVAVTVSPRDGSLYIAEADNEFVHRVRRVDTYKLQIATVAGADTSCDCQMSDCDCFQGDGDFARSARLNTPAALAAAPNGSVYIADQLNLRIRMISTTLAKPDGNGKIRIANPDSNHVYVFSKDGLHLTTQNVITGMPVYNFTYSPEEKLNSISDIHGNRLSIIRDNNEIPTKILLPNREIWELQFDKETNSLQRIAEEYLPPIVTLTYQGDDSSLLQSITHGRSSASFYVYDVNGRLVSAVSPSGSVTMLYMKVNSTTHTVTMSTAATSIGASDASDRGVGARDVVIATEPGYICDIIKTKEGDMTATYERWTDNSISVRFLDGSELSLETKPHPVLGLTAPFLAKRTIHLTQDPLENNIEWRARKQLEPSSSRGERYLLGRRMRVNGRNILSLDYSQNEKMEKIYDDHTKFTLKIYYDNRGMPRLWVPSGGITPVNVTYDATGHPTTWQRGTNEETVKYDTGGRIVSRKTADGAIWTYINQDDDVQLTVPGTRSHYGFIYDNFENVRRITLPSSEAYIVTRFMGIGFKRIQIENSAGTVKTMVDVDDRNNVLVKKYGGEGRKVVYRYDTHGHMTEVLHDKQQTRMLRDPRTGELVSMTTRDCITRFYRNGPLVQKLTVTSQPARFRKEFSAKFEYSHDVNLRLKSLKATINETSLPMTSIEYDDVSGKITTFGLYSVYYFRANMYMISATDVAYTKEHDHSGRPVQVKLDIYRNPFFLLDVRYDVMGRVTNQNIRVGLPANETEMTYEYNTDGSLSSVGVRGTGKQSWRYSYDTDGKLTSIRHESDAIRIRYDQSGRVAARGSLKYTYDKDGFLSSREKEIFEYDSQGHLVAAYRTDGQYRLQYGYDGFGRLSSRFNEQTKHVLRFYYADVAKPARVTHYYNSTSGLITTLQYDTEGNLFALDQSNGQTWSVMCDNNGSPLAVIGASGNLLKTMSYTPLGEMEWDSNSLLQIVIGYRGGIYDPATGLVHFADRSMIQQSYRFGEKKVSHNAESLAGVDYDPLVAQTTSPDYTMLINKREKVPQPLKIYQVVDPVNPVPPYNQMTLVSSWLDALGFKLQNVAPDPKIDDRQKDKSSVECQLSHHLQTYMNLQTVSFSSLVSENRKNFKQIPNGALFAQGLVLSIDKGSIATHVSSSATNDVKRLSTVLSGGEVIIGKNADSPSAPMSFSDEGKPVIYVSKSLNSLKADKITLSLSDDSRTLDGGYSNVGTNTGSGSSKSNSIQVEYNSDIITAESPHCIVVISYVTNDNRNGKTKASEETRVTEIAREQAEKEAWAIERRKLQTGQRSRWSAREKQDLRTRGRVDGYRAVFFWDVNKYPEFADSGRNVNFVKT